MQHKISRFFAFSLNLAMAALGAVMFFFLLREGYYLGHLFFQPETEHNFSLIAEATIAFFLYFEFIALVKAYFEENAHISLNRFIYIGITALLRAVIVQHDDALHTLLLALAILTLVGALQLIPQASDIK
ncbi:phosphate-starvation-inducible PsiE family protein [Loigolactobacillus jiayinensis]|uniref:Protein PsiE n=1 Tax=Loigolactobacillus jiayinensis TaxID=2486016 RepID=A0ABW1RF68_9LACO|nr:phosphate-starvation-inducible PsiE family protein [Loigolactobacillus jiayinensis]